MDCYFTFPVVDYDEDEPENSRVTLEEGGISSVRFDKEPYEAVLYARDEVYPLIFGHCSDGYFLCITDRNLGCKFESLNDIDSNMDVLLSMEILDYEECTAITMGLACISSTINQQ